MSGESRACCEPHRRRIDDVGALIGICVDLGAAEFGQRAKNSSMVGIEPTRSRSSLPWAHSRGFRTRSAAAHGSGQGRRVDSAGRGSVEIEAGRFPPIGKAYGRGVHAIRNSGIPSVRIHRSGTRVFAVAMQRRAAREPWYIHQVVEREIRSRVSAFLPGYTSRRLGWPKNGSRSGPEHASAVHAFATS